MRMANVIDFKDFVNYKKKLSEVIQQVTELSEAIEENLFDLACLGKWKEWDKQQPVGTEFYVTEEMLRNTGDKNIDLLWSVLDKIEDVKEEIKNTAKY